MSRKFWVALIVCLIMPTLPRLALSWSSDGHRTVGAIADVLLDQHPTTRDRVKEILNGRSLSEVSVFADCAKGFEYCHRNPSPEESAYTRNPDHHGYHYTDVPIQQKHYALGSAGTTKDDVVQVIRYAIQVLQGQTPSGGAADLKESEALWVLVHLVGDIHQPLHVGAVYYDRACDEIVDPNFGIGTSVLGTTGGNDLMYTEKQNLHHFWDAVAVTGAARLRGIKGKVVAVAFAKAIVARPPASWETPGELDSWPAKWATESLLLADEALTEPEFDDASRKTTERGTTCTASVSIDQDYRKQASNVALVQLGKAGFRLNALLVSIFEGR
jgi:hypothetical protein